MPAKLNVGLTKKLGEPHYGSRGASINIEVEVESSLITEPAKLRERLRQLFGFVRNALAEELNGNVQDHSTDSASSRVASKSAAVGAGNGHSHAARPQSKELRPATPAQIKAIHAIARSQELNLVSFLLERFHVGRPDRLTLAEARQAIDQLKSGPNHQNRQG